jgi:aryl-alcohol dehydrogenase-like predicted oxidoreductase
MPDESLLWGSRRRGIFQKVLRGRAVDVLVTVREVAERVGATVAQVALAWVLSRPEITVAISGADTAAQLEENLGAAELELPAEELQRLNDVSLGLGLTLDGPTLEPDRETT